MLEAFVLPPVLKKMGYPRLIISGFLIFLFIMTPFVGVNPVRQIGNIINRFSWNAVLVLAMVPMIHSGCGLNFGIPLGVLAGLLGGTLAIEMGFTGPMSFVVAILVATPFAILFGGGYGALLNRIKGGEMMVATYVGFSSVSFMCIMWLLIPYKNPSIVMAYTGVGLRNMFALDSFYAGVLSKPLELDLNSLGINLVIPNGSLLFFALLAFQRGVFFVLLCSELLILFRKHTFVFRFQYAKPALENPFGIVFFRITQIGNYRF